MACTTGVKSEQFPAGLKVLVVDDDVTCLRILEKMLQKCMYRVTICSQAKAALNLLRERKGYFDVVLSDVHMPDMDGFRLLELVGLEMDLPVIMMSCDDRTTLVMKGIRHGACDYLIKPVRDEELKNIWQHVVRKRRNEYKEHDHSGCMEDHDHRKRAIDDGADVVNKAQKKRREFKGEDDTDMHNDDSTTSKKPRVVWSVELHQQFVAAVNQLGIDKAVPKSILEIMNVPSLTRENVASHLQKFRLYLKRLSGVAQQQDLPTSYCGPVEQNLKLDSLGRFDIQALTTSGELPPQTLADLLSRSSGNLILPVIDQSALFIEPRRTINVQPSCLVIPSQSLPNFQAAKSPVSVNQNCSFRNPALDYNRSVLQSTNSSGVGQSLGAEYKRVSMPSEFGAASYGSSMSSCSRIGNISQRKQFVDNNSNKVKHEPNK